MLEKISTAPPRPLTVSTRSTYFRRCTGSEDLVALSQGGASAEHVEHAPEEVVRNKESPDGSSVYSHSDVIRSIPRPHLILSEHFVESGNRQFNSSGHTSITYLSSIIPSLANLVSFS